MRSNLTVKISVCWVTTRSVEGTHILNMKSIISVYRDMKYSIEISLMGTFSLGPATLVGVTKVYIL